MLACLVSGLKNILMVDSRFNMSLLILEFKSAYIVAMTCQENAQFPIFQRIPNCLKRSPPTTRCFLRGKRWNPINCELANPPAAQSWFSLRKIPTPNNLPKSSRARQQKNSRGKCYNIHSSSFKLEKFSRHHLSQKTGGDLPARWTALKCISFHEK